MPDADDVSRHCQCNTGPSIEALHMFFFIKLGGWNVTQFCRWHLLGGCFDTSYNTCFKFPALQGFFLVLHWFALMIFWLYECHAVVCLPHWFAPVSVQEQSQKWPWYHITAIDTSLSNRRCCKDSWVTNETCLREKFVPSTFVGWRRSNALYKVGFHQASGPRAWAYFFLARRRFPHANT